MDNQSFRWAVIGKWRVARQEPVRTAGEDKVILTLVSLECPEVRVDVMAPRADWTPPVGAIGEFRFHW